MSTYTCYDRDRKDNWYILTVEIRYDKKGVRSDTVIRVVHLGQHYVPAKWDQYQQHVMIPGYDGWLEPFWRTVTLPEAQLIGK